MPIYEYRCLACQKRSTILVLSLANQSAAICKHCGSAKLERLMSRFAAPRSEEARIEALADPSNLGDLDENDPQSMERFMKKMGREMGEDFGDDLSEGMEPDETDLQESGDTDSL
jgi:putative FmdB family regulatory protein